MTWSLLSPKTRRGRFIAALLLLHTVSGSVVLAQDSHYWTNQYGTESWLLGGAVVGASADLASTYYNPAALAVIQDRRSLLTAVSLLMSLSRIPSGSNSLAIFNELFIWGGGGLGALRLG